MGELSCCATPVALNMRPLRNTPGRLRHLLSQRGPKLLRDLMSLVTGQLASMFVGVAAFAALARMLTPVDYGAVEFAISLASFGAMVINCGIGTIGVREIAAKPNRAGEIAAQVVTARFGLALLVVPAIGLLGIVTGQPPETAVLIWIVALSLFALPFKQDWILQAHEKMHQAALAQPLRTLVFALGVLLLVTPESSLPLVGWIEAASVIGMCGFYVYAQYRWTVPFRGGWPRTAPVYFLREGIAVGLSNILWAFMLYMPMVLLVSLGTADGPAWLGAAQRLIISLLTLSFLYFFNLYPVITRTVKDASDVWTRVMTASIHVVAWTGIGVATAITLLANWIMTLIFGADFTTAAPVLIALSWVFPLRVLTGHGRWSLIAAGKQKFLLFGEIAGAVTLVITAVIAIPAIDAPGAALALFAGILASGCVTQLAVAREIGPLALLRPVIHPVVAAIAAIGLAPQITDDALLRGLVGGVIYFAVGAPQLRPFFKNLHRISYAKQTPGYTA